MRPPADVTDDAHVILPLTRLCPVRYQRPDAPGPLEGEPPDHAAHGRGLQWRTWIIRNLPNRVSKEELLSYVRELGFRGSYEFFHMPWRVRHNKNKGYAFISFSDMAAAEAFKDLLNGYQLSHWRTNCSKTIRVEPARLQSLEEIAGYLTNSWSPEHDRDSDLPVTYSL